MPVGLANLIRVNIDDKDCLFHVILSKLSSNLTPSQIEILLALLQHARLRGKEIDLPEGMSTLTRVYSGGKRSISKSLPGPTPVKIPDSEFSYLSHKDIVWYIFLTSRYPHPFGQFQDVVHAN